MAKNHYVSKRNRRPVSGKRGDTKRIARNMAILKQKQAEERGHWCYEHECPSPCLYCPNDDPDDAVRAITEFNQQAEEFLTQDEKIQKRFDEDGLGTAHSFEEAFGEEN